MGIAGQEPGSGGAARRQQGPHTRSTPTHRHTHAAPRQSREPRTDQAPPRTGRHQLQPREVKCGGIESTSPHRTGWMLGLCKRSGQAQITIIHGCVTCISPVLFLKIANISYKQKHQNTHTAPTREDTDAPSPHGQAPSPALPPRPRGRVDGATPQASPSQRQQSPSKARILPANPHGLHSNHTQGFLRDRQL